MSADVTSDAIESLGLHTQIQWIRFLVMTFKTAEHDSKNPHRSFLFIMDVLQMDSIEQHPTQRSKRTDAHSKHQEERQEAATYDRILSAFEERLAHPETAQHQIATDMISNYSAVSDICAHCTLETVPSR